MLGGGLAIAAALLAAIHIANARLAGEARSAVGEARAVAPGPAASPDDPAVALAALDRLSASPLAGGPPAWWRRAGLNAGDLDDLQAETQRLDRDLLRDGLLGRLAGRILERIERPDIAPELAFEGLKAVLALGDADAPRQDDLIRLWATIDWSMTEPSPDRRERLARQLDRALAAEPRLLPAVDAAAIDRVRARLRQTPLAVRAYAAIRSSEAAQALPPFRADLVLGADGWPLTRRSGASLATPIPGLLTADGFHRVMAPALADLSGALQADAWVLGDSGRPETVGRTLAATVLGLYLDDTARAWDSLLDDLEVTLPGADPGSAGRVIDALTRSPGPLLRLALAARQATLFDRASGADAVRLSALAEAVGGTRPWTAIDRRYAWLLGGDGRDLPGFGVLIDAAQPLIDSAGGLPGDAPPSASPLD
ncbi:ImcF-related family protein [Inquilinus sp. Marseille-Q2685]|uniref:ImcF-related family protein n=1 Tax=Inquilinus sp. Marseille-Q2685 TaxID=2866581 RepID=UPI001CE41D75|nr:ImcF-related family protein [Inquilinus sp. Marseille-Q2685]